MGKEGVGPLIGRLHAARPELRIHLIGHSFGARLVSFALAGLPDPVGTAGAASPIKSLVLLQGAFSHFTFADSLPHNPRQSGALAGLARRVDGPLVVSHSEKDLAVGKYYPLASFASGDDSGRLRGPAIPLGGNGPRWCAGGAGRRVSSTPGWSGVLVYGRQVRESRRQQHSYRGGATLRRTAWTSFTRSSPGRCSPPVA